MNRREGIVLGLVAGLVVVVGVIALAVSRNESGSIEAGPGASTTISANTTSPSTNAPAMTSATTAAPATAAPTTAAPTTVAPTLPPQSMPPASLPSGLVRQDVGPLHQGGGRLVQLVEPEDTECRQGLLAVEVAGDIVHVYEDLGPIGGLSLFNGPYSQVAMLEYCEEWPVSILFTETSGLGPGEPPEFARGLLPDDVVYLGDPGWLALTGWFSATATRFDETSGDGWNEQVVFDTLDGTMLPWATSFGFRDELPGYGIDFIVPHNWNYSPVASGETRVSLWDMESASAVDIDVYGGAVSAPAPEAHETARDVISLSVQIWEDLGDGRARHSATAPATDYEFTSDGGFRVVRVLELSDRTIVLESFLASGAGQAFLDVPRLALDSIRIFDAVG